MAIPLAVAAGAVPPPRASCQGSTIGLARRLGSSCSESPGRGRRSLGGSQTARSLRQGLWSSAASSRGVVGAGCLGNSPNSGHLAFRTAEALGTASASVAVAPHGLLRGCPPPPTRAGPSAAAAAGPSARARQRSTSARGEGRGSSRTPSRSRPVVPGGGGGGSVPSSIATATLAGAEAGAAVKRGRSPSSSAPHLPSRPSSSSRPPSAVQRPGVGAVSPMRAAQLSPDSGASPMSPARRRLDRSVSALLGTAPKVDSSGGGGGTGSNQRNGGSRGRGAHEMRCTSPQVVLEDDVSAASCEELHTEVARLREMLAKTQQRIERATEDVTRDRELMLRTREQQARELPEAEAELQDLVEENKRLQKEVNTSWSSARRAQATAKLGKERACEAAKELEERKRRLEQDNIKLRKEVVAMRARLQNARQMRQRRNNSETSSAAAVGTLVPTGEHASGAAAGSASLWSQSEDVSTFAPSEAATGTSTPVDLDAGSAFAGLCSKAVAPTTSKRLDGHMSASAVCTIGDQRSKCKASPNEVMPEGGGVAFNCAGLDMKKPFDALTEAACGKASLGTSDCNIADLLGEAESHMQRQLVELSTRLEQVRALRLAACNASTSDSSVAVTTAAAAAVATAASAAVSASQPVLASSPPRFQGEEESEARPQGASLPFGVPAAVGAAPVASEEEEEEAADLVNSTANVVELTTIACA
mmetsp:Transcript_121115/g.302245  ORF Transcript_121115/g.302245 Transcript_121115/m.302245 type:complete len:704 (-) Transcript_121115:62-2173(-)